jgi:hypothetical protein
MTINLKVILKDCLQLEIASLRDLGRMIHGEDIFCVLRSVNDILEEIPQAELKERWDNELKVHITLKDKAFLEDFPNGYCYFPEMWENQIQIGKKILILCLVH